MKLVLDKSNPPLGGLITAHHIQLKNKVSFELSWSNEGSVVGKVACRSSVDVSRALARLHCVELYGGSATEMTEVDSWLNFSSGPLASKEGFNKAINVLNKALGPVTYLANKRATIADFAVFATLYESDLWTDLLKSKSAPQNVQRWYNFILAQEAVESAIAICPAKIRASPEKTIKTGEGKFVELPGAEMGKVVVRFPPEASGYLHIGHAKAALLNQYYQEAFQGKLIMRFDDTNPAKEDLHFEKVILEDVEMLDIKPDIFTHTSQYFDLMLDLCEKMLKEEKAYVDDTEAELMKEQRDQKIESANRTNSIEKNFQLWEEMKKGSPTGQKCCVRAKIDMQSPNGCLRDPTIYRCKNEPHPRYGDKYKVYPTYDFACPIVDSIEGVTHVLRTLEYHDRDPQFFWFIDALGLRKPHIWEYSRLSMTNTVLSKRKLTWFVNEGLVDGWDDPRMPTVRGVLRRGMTVEGLKEFIIGQGSSRSVVFMEWDKIWATNKKVIDPIAPRFTAVEYDNHATIKIPGAKSECLKAAKHPKNAEIGTKDVWIGEEIIIDGADVALLEQGKNATFINWGNLLITDTKADNLKAELNLDNKDYKKTPKITWLAKTSKADFTPTYCVYFDHIIGKALLGKDEDFKNFIGHKTRAEVRMLGDPELKTLKKGDIIQLQRKGFFIVDVPYAPASLNICKEQPIVLFYIPDGSKDNPMARFQDQPKTDTKQPKVSKKQDKNQTAAATTDGSKSSAEINAQIISQGDKVRDLKTNKADKTTIDAAVKTLLSLKAEYKAATGSDWKPGAVPTTAAKPASNSADESAILLKIQQQGEKVRDLKAQKADKAAVDAEVKALLALKADYKQLTGKDWKPGTVAQPAAAAPSNTSANQADEAVILQKISEQGEKVRDLKTKKADKSAIDAEVKDLLALKADYKALTGKEWKPGAVAQPAAAAPSNTSANQANEAVILQKISAQGDKVRDLKAQKADKSAVDAEVKALLALKADYKQLTGKDWKPGTAATTTVNQPQADSGKVSESDILQKISAQGEKVRDLKAKKADKAVVDSEVKTLLSLKADYKQLTGQDWKPGAVAPKTGMAASGDAKQVLTDKISSQGEMVREMKAKQAAKGDLDAAVKHLLSLKAEYKTLTGTDFPVAGRQPSKPKEAKEVKKETKASNAKAKTEKPKVADESGVKKQTRLGLEAKKSENLPDWYSQVITKGEMIEYYDVSGCYILRPWSFAIWDSIREWFDAEIKKLGVQNCYFPIFVSKAVLEKEKDHIEDFSPEVAWVTKSGDSEMAEPIAVRPTSETVMYPAYAKWVQSYRDLPIKLNQWNNVVRWEFKHPQPFLRTREFLWQEGHTAYAEKEEAEKEVTTILDLYARIYTDLLAIPVVKGRKTEKEKFAGGDYTLTVEAFVSASGRAIQGATSHHLGQNFSKIFEIVYEHPDTQDKRYVYQNSWGLTTRTIGVMVMVHADDQGLVLPPRVASVQCVIVPCGITASLAQAQKDKLQASCDALENELKQAGVKVRGDYRDNYSPGWKFNHWELKGVPIRIEYGPKDIEKGQLIAVRRDTGEKITVTRTNAAETISNLLETIHKSMLARAEKELDEHKVLLTDWAQFPSTLDKKNIILCPFCLEKECEERIKADSTRDEGADPGAPSMGAKSLCIPLEQPMPIKPTDKCIHPDCKRKPKAYTLFGRSY